MIVDSMTEQDIYNALKKEYDIFIDPYLNKRTYTYAKAIRDKCPKGDKIVKLPWVEVCSQNNILFRIIVVAEFKWKDKDCYAYYCEDKQLNVFQGHCIERFNERVLKKDIKTREVFYKYILPNISNAYRTVLPSPTHKYSLYISIGNALFLGDFNPDTNSEDNWFNTCISLNEAGISQTKIFQTLKFVQEDINEIGFNIFDPSELDDGDFQKLFAKIPRNESAILALQRLVKNIYLIDKLTLILDYPFISKFKDSIDYRNMISKTFLKVFDIDYTKLTPYGKDGIAVRGELDFKG